MRAYKVFDKDWKCRDFQYEIGKRYVMDKLPILCEQGFHACVKIIKCFDYYDFNPNNKVAVVELHGDIVGKIDDKYATNDIEIIKEISWHELLDMVNIGVGNTGHSNTGDGNTGDGNTGDWNAGYRNTGHSNTGHSNTGHRNAGDGNTGDWNTGDSNTGDGNTGDGNAGHSNTGHRNTGDGNTGHRNTGHRNTGHGNTGHRNAGHRNTGHRNTGHRNTGHSNTGDGNTGDGNTGDWNAGYRNTGHSNTGHRNTGDWNAGDWNAGSYNVGDFNTVIPDKVLFFNRWIEWSEFQKIRGSEAYEILNRFRFMKYRIRRVTGKYGDYRYMLYQNSFKYFWRNLTVKERKIIKEMPYFNKDVFFEITGAK